MASNEYVREGTDMQVDIEFCCGDNTFIGSYILEGGADSLHDFAYQWRNRGFVILYNPCSGYKECIPWGPHVSSFRIGRLEVEHDIPS